MLDKGGTHKIRGILFLLSNHLGINLKFLKTLKMIDFKVGSVMCPPTPPQKEVSYNLRNSHMYISFMTGWLYWAVLFLEGERLFLTHRKSICWIKIFLCSNIYWEVLTVLLQHATQKWLEICSFGSLQIIAGAKGLVIFFYLTKVICSSW